MDSRLPWYSGVSSTGNLDAGPSSILQSIYGSQVSSLPFSDYDSESNLLTLPSEHQVNHLSPVKPRHLSRPKSSPVSVIVTRERLKEQTLSTPLQTGSSVSTVLKSSSAAASTIRVDRGRPASAAFSRPVQRPGSAVVRGGASPTRRRPKTAMESVNRSQSGLSTVLLDLEEEWGEVAAPIIRDTTPVHVTHTVEYFDFWQGKPLREREFGVKIHDRKAWQRPKSGYGNRSFTGDERNVKNSTTAGEGDGRGGDGLGTLTGKYDSTIGSGDSKWKDRHHGNIDLHSRGDGSSSNGSKKSGNGQYLGEDTLKLSVCGSGVGSRRGSEDFGDKNRRHRDSLHRDRSSSSSSQNMDLDHHGNAGRGSKSVFDHKDKETGADSDEYFRNKALASTSWMDGSGLGSGGNTRFELPMDLQTLEGMSPVQYLVTHCIISNRRMDHCSKVFGKLDKNKNGRLHSKEVAQGLVQVHYNCITLEQAGSVLDSIQMTEEMEINLKLFAAISCLAERMLNLFFLPMARKEVIETVDFEALDWKLRSYTVNAPLQTLFTHL